VQTFGRLIQHHVRRGAGLRDGVVVVGLFLKETVDLEPVGAAAVTGATLGHSHHQTFSEAARFAGRPVFLVDHALAAVFALGDA